MLPSPALDRRPGGSRTRERGERLARPAVPTHYDLVFEPVLARRKVLVRQVIHLDVVRSTKSLALHAVEIDVLKATARIGRESMPVEAAPGRDGRTIRFRFPRMLEKGPVRLELRAEAELRTKDLEGIYLARRGQDEFVVTQFEPTDARRAFVCLDEPDAKATFSIAATVPSDWTAYSNEPVRRWTERARGG